MLEDILEIRRVNGNDVYFIKSDKQVKNKPTELEKIIKYVTYEDFEDYASKKDKRRLLSRADRYRYNVRVNSAARLKWRT